MIINNESIDEILKHSLHYTRYNNIGALIGKNDEIKRVIPICHTTINQCILETYLEIVENKLKEEEFIIGFYEIQDDIIDENEVFTVGFNSLLEAYKLSKNKNSIYGLKLNFKEEDKILIDIYSKKKKLEKINIKYDDPIERLSKIKNEYFNFDDIEEILNNKIIN